MRVCVVYSVMSSAITMINSSATQTPSALQNCCFSALGLILIVIMGAYKAD